MHRQKYAHIKTEEKTPYKLVCHENSGITTKRSQEWMQRRRWVWIACVPSGTCVLLTSLDFSPSFRFHDRKEPTDVLLRLFQSKPLLLCLAVEVDFTLFVLGLQRRKMLIKLPQTGISTKLTDLLCVCRWRRLLSFRWSPCLPSDLSLRW